MPNMFSFVNTKNQPTAARKPKLGMTLLALSCTLGLHTTAYANDWWFDIEVIVFKRDIAAQSIAESFAHKAPEFASPTAFDLLSDYVSPDLTYMSAGLPSCDASVEVNKKEQRERQFTLANTVFTETDYSYLDVQDEPAADETTALINQLRGSAQSDPTNIVNTQVYSDGDNTKQSGAQVTPSASPTLSEPTWVKWQIPRSLPCAFEQDRVLLAGPYDKPIDVKQPKRIPIHIDGVEWPNRQSPYLLPKSAQQLAKLEEHIRWQKDLTPILHLTWRQPVVFGKDKAQPFRLIAGENYAQAYDQDGQRKVETPLNEVLDPRFMNAQQNEDSMEKGLSNQALFAQINAALASPEPAKVIDFSQGNTADADASIDAEDFIQVAEKPLWQVEGDFKVYLENLGRTPYLHIDSNLDYRAPITLRLPGETDVQPNNFLQSFHFDQLRRVISKQLHYFDHPLFGMVVQIRRYEPPKETDNN
ncbi:CsiV family protein [Paraglaciecola mesophila]|uniref:CsiV family protein n=1 Tax=Paraglaciecola mesophila TaxID=197222 RepID=A0ABU9SR17_9ALTE